MEVAVQVAITSQVRFVGMHRRIHVPIDSLIPMDIERMQVLFHLCAIGMQIIGIVLILIIQVARHVVMDLVAVEILVDIETIPPLMVAGDMLAGLLAEVMMDLVMVDGKLEEKVCLEAIQMYGQEMVIGCARIPLNDFCTYESYD